MKHPQLYETFISKLCIKIHQRAVKKDKKHEYFLFFIFFLIKLPNQITRRKRKKKKSFNKEQNTIKRRRRRVLLSYPYIHMNSHLHVYCIWEKSSRINNLSFSSHASSSSSLLFFLFFLPICKNSKVCDINFLFSSFSFAF